MLCCTTEKSAPNTTRVMGSDIWFRRFILFGDHRSSAPSDVLLHVARAGNGGGVLAVDHRILLRQLAAVRDCCAKLKTSARARVCANCRSSGDSVDHKMKIITIIQFAPANNDRPYRLLHHAANHLDARGSLLPSVERVTVTFTFTFTSPPPAPAPPPAPSQHERGFMMPAAACHGAAGDGWRENESEGALDCGGRVTRVISSSICARCCCWRDQREWLKL